MATKSNASELTRLVTQLRQERQQHLDAIAEIDATFQAFGIAAGGTRAAGGKKPGPKGKRGRPAATETAGATKGKGKRRGPGKGKAKAGAKAKGKGKGKGRAAGAPKKGGGRSPWSSKFPMTGDELILAFVKDKGGATTEEIRKHWETSGRRGKAENNLTTLVKSGKLKRTKLENKPGSNYTIP